MRRLQQLLLTLVLLAALGLMAGQAFAAGTNVTGHTQSEIINYIEQSGASIYDATEYSVEPVKSSVRGEMSNKSKNGALAILNNIRYIAGLNPVTLDDDEGDLAQAAAFVNYSIGKLTHYPKSVTTKPETMSDKDWEDGATGAGSSNIARGQRSMNSAVLDWTFDEDAGNISVVGHRRWCLNPGMGKTGFGAAGSFYAMYSFDGSGVGGQTRVAWPAENMPVEYFGRAIPWSFSVGKTVNASNVTVTLKRVADGKIWSFNGASSYNPSNMEYFNVDNLNYGQVGCIIFRPDIDGYKAGDIFNVTITGVDASPITYTVNFFTAIPMKGIQFDETEGTITEGEQIKPSLYALPFDCEEEIDQSKVTYTSSNSNVATVSDSGVIEGVSPGKAVITANYQGMKAEYTISVKKSLYDAVYNGFTLSNPTYTGKVVSPTCELKDGDKVLIEGKDYETNLEDETIECDGKQHKINFIGLGDYTGSIYANYTVKPKGITEDMISCAEDDLYFSGEPQVPDVSLKYNDMVLSLGKDYSLTPEENPVSVGEHVIKIAGTGNYTGEYSFKYTIQQKPLSEDWMTLGDEKLVYNGEQQSPSLTVKAGQTVLKEGTDYVVKPDESINAGTWQLTVTGINNYCGEVKVPYTIAKADHPPVLPAESINVANSVKELSNDILAETPGWEFAETDLGKELVAGETAEFTATYTGEDAGNYKTLTAVVKVTRSACDHEHWELRGKKAPTCKDPGWSGDKYCLDCEELIEAGHEIPVTEDHVAGKAVAENNVDPGCETQGSYDVVIYCDVCGRELTRETVTVPATGHAWDEGVITAYPTADADGVRTFTCGNCGQVRTEPIPKDVDEITPSEEMAENAPVDDSIPVVSTSKIKTVSNLKKKQMSVKFPSNAAVDNYRIQYRLAGKATWKNAWSAGTDSYVIKGLKRYSLCEFRIAGFAKQPDGTWIRGNWSKTAYRYANAVALKNAKAGKKSIKVTWAKDAKATGYQVQYSLKSNMKGAKTITVKGKTKTKYTIKGLKSGKKYYVKVRPIKKSGKTYIGSLSKAKAVKVK